MFIRTMAKSLNELCPCKKPALFAHIWEQQRMHVHGRAKTNALLSFPEMDQFQT